MKASANILHTLMWLFSTPETLFTQDKKSKSLLNVTDKTEISQLLKGAGLNPKELNTAIKWLERFAQLPQLKHLNYHHNTTRIFSPYETSAIPQIYLNVLQHDYQTEEITAAEFELMIEQLISLDHYNISADEFEWVYDMMLAHRVSKRPRRVQDKSPITYHYTLQLSRVH